MSIASLRSRALLGGIVLAVVLSRQAFPQEATATLTRRPTPLPTATRTPTIPSTPTPTRPPAGTEYFLCSAGGNDGGVCASDEDCPAGACVLTLGVCDGGSNDGTPCDADGDCAGATCLLTHEVCIAGDRSGLPCVRDSQCGTGILCGSTGLFCDGGPYDLSTCVNDEDCTSEGSDPGYCLSPAAYLCSGGGNDGAQCADHPDCGDGACVLAIKLCGGGTEDGYDCESSLHCPGDGVCTATQRVCSGGEFDGFGCLRDEHCPGGSCVSTGLFCDGGILDLYSCVSDTNCRIEGETPGTCEMPVPERRLCSSGSNDGRDCATGADCPQGACVRTQGVCDGGDNDAIPCDSNGDCGNAQCRPAYKVCTQGDVSGFSCLRDSQCGDQPSERCAASGLACTGGPYDGFSCTGDAACYDAGSAPGACEGVVPRACTLETPCSLAERAEEQVFSASNAPVPPASADYYLSPLPEGAAGAVFTLRAVGGDADLYLGQTPSPVLEDYSSKSENPGDVRETLRLVPQSVPSFAELTAGRAALALAVVGFDGAPTYVIEAVYLGPSNAGDLNCDGAATEADADALIAALFDAAWRVSSGGPFGRCLGGDANDDGAETAADLAGIAAASR